MLHRHFSQVISTNGCGQLLVVSALLMAPPVVAEDGQTGHPVEMEPSVVSVLETLVRASPQHVLRRVSVSRTSSNNPTSVALDMTYEPLGLNLFGIETIATAKSYRIRMRTVSLCGLINLLGTVDGSVSSERLVPIPFGKLFMPMGTGIMASQKVSSVSRVVELKVAENSASICHPLPGQTYSFSFRKESQSPSTSIFSNSPITKTFMIAWTCVAGEPASAAAISAGLQGDYLPLMCQGIEGTSQKKSFATYAFLIRQGVYLATEGDGMEAFGDGSIKFKFSVLASESES